MPPQEGAGILRSVPTYDYRCERTGEMFEIWQSFSDDTLTECPSCGAPVKKVFSKVGIAFKGDGFYKNDHGSSAASSGSGSSSSSTSSDAGSSESSSSSSSSSDTASSSSSSD